MSVKEIDEEISGIKAVRVETEGTSIMLYKLKGEKRSKRISMNPQHIRNSSVRNVVQCIRYLKQELKGIKVNHCSFQLVCALVAKYLGKSKKYYFVKDRTYGTTPKYPRGVYDLAHAVHFLSIELNF